ncbi:transmembrane channel-like protein 7 [Arctopsyche grandis]|uniref:transmembrane channel-like protein 7 n=1 Tax=Arctopsyche grandis TaxID=121162 RepID=UPI00406D7343
MPRINKNKVSIADDVIEPQNSFEMRHRSSNRRRQMFDRSMSSDDEGSGYISNRDWLEAAKTVRRTQSLHRNAMQQNVIKMLPSRHNAYFGTVRVKVLNSEDLSLIDGESQNEEESQVQDIVQQIEENELLMEDTPDGEALRIEALREIPQCLTVKRNIRAKLSASVSRKSKHRPIGCFKRLKYRTSFWWKKMKQNIRNLLFSMELWYEGIRNVEGHFGSGVATYFRFLRLLFLLNVFLTLFVVGFVVIPQALHTSYNNATIESLPFKFLDIFTGQGSFTNTTLYYGFYAPDTVSSNNILSYDIPNAYFFTMFFMYIFILVVLSIRMARSYRTSFIETAGGLKNVYANKIFCGWDFSIATAEAASLKSKSIYNELREILSEDYRATDKHSFCDNIYLFSVKIFMHIFVLVLLGLTGLVMWVLMDESIVVSDVVTAIRVSNQKSIVMAVIVTLIIFALPILFSYIMRFEKYNNPRTSLYVTLLRTFILEALVVSILGIFWLRSSNTCWETSLGQEVYRLVIFDFFISIIGLPLFECMRSLIFKHLWSDIGPPEFDIARNTLGLIYNQTLLFLGFFYSPLLPFIVTLKFAILYYVRKYTVLRNCKPSNKSWKAAQMHTVFLVLIFLSLLFILLALGYVFIRVKIGHCGPFQKYDYMYLVFLEGILNLKEGNGFFTFIMIFAKPGVVAFILIAMSVVVYYLRAKSLAEKGMVSQLRDMLVLQSKDKEFLLNAIARVTEGHWIYNQKPDSSMDVSSTWKYVKDANKMRKPSNSEFKFEVNSPQKRSIHQDSPSTSANTPVSGIGLRRNYENVQIHD